MGTNECSKRLYKHIFEYCLTFKYQIIRKSMFDFHS